MSLQSFFESTAGQFAVAGVIILLFLGIVISGGKKKFDTKVMVVSAILVALGIVLNEITIFRMPQGGSVTALSMLPVVLCGYFFGVRRGVMAGMCVGLITLMFNPYVIHPMQLLLDYPIAFGALGFSGFLRNRAGGLIGGYVIGVLGRYACSVLSGVIFFGSYAPEGTNVWVYSMVYNGTYVGVEMLITIVLLAVPQIRRSFARIKETAEPKLAA